MHFTTGQRIEICFTVGLSNLISGVHATVLTVANAETQEPLAPRCPLPTSQSRRPAGRPLRRRPATGRHAADDRRLRRQPGPATPGRLGADLDACRWKPGT